MMALRKGEDIQKLSCSYFNVEFRRWWRIKKDSTKKETKKGFQGGSGHLLNAIDGPDEDLK